MTCPIPRAKGCREQERDKSRWPREHAKDEQDTDGNLGKPCMGAAIAAWFAAKPITAFQIAGEWLFLM